MSRKIAITAILFGWPVAFWGGAEAGPKTPSLDWMTGCWVHSNGKTVEHWDQGFVGLYFGRSVTSDGDQLIEFEDMRIHKAEGRLVFSASPNGRTPVEFVSRMSDRQSITFENAEHDFPQRIVYQRQSKKLMATISDMSGETSISFGMERCESK